MHGLVEWHEPLKSTFHDAREAAGLGLQWMRDETVMTALL
jgi:hypothetical protein